MIRTGDQYREAINTGREIYIDGEQVHDVTKHPMFAPIVDIRARIYDLAHEAASQDVMTYVDEDGERNAIANKMPLTQQDWHDKRKAIDLVLDEARGVVTRVGDETVGDAVEQERPHTDHDGQAEHRRQHDDPQLQGGPPPGEPPQEPVHRCSLPLRADRRGTPPRGPSRRSRGARGRPRSWSAAAGRGR